MAQRLAHALGWFSLGLGTAEVVAPRGVARLIGVEDHARNRATLRAAGVREVGSGAGILSPSNTVGWLWSRVAGDAMDLALLGAALAANLGKRNRRRRVMAATGAVAGVTALDLFTSIRLSRATGLVARAGVMRGTASITINRPVDEVYRYWHDFENLPRFMSHLHSVQMTGPNRSRWRARTSARRAIEWEAEIVDDRVDELITWRSVDGSDVPNAGSVLFRPAPGQRGTEVTVELRYSLPGGRAGSLFAKALGEEPVQQMKDDLRRFKQVMETGEVTRSEGSPEGTNTRRQWMQRPAQPPVMAGGR